MAEHDALMDKDKRWFSDLEWNGREEMHALARLHGSVAEAVRETGYQAAEALRLQRMIGVPETVKTIWKDYHAEMERAYERKGMTC